MSVIESLSSNIYRSWAYLTHGRTMAVLLGIGFAVLAVLLLIASRTRWGQTKPLTKCVVLSILAHVWLLMYAYGTRITLPQGNPQGSQEALAISLEQQLADMPAMPSLDPPLDPSSSPPPWEQVNAPDLLPADKLPQPTLDQLAAASSLATDPLPTLPTELPEFTELTAATQPDSGLADAPPASASPNDTSPVLPPLIPPAMEPPLSLASPPAALPQDMTPPPIAPSAVQTQSDYSLRSAADRLQQVAAFGADADTEAAVDAALYWLAQAQSEDGAWNARRFGAGTETRALGEYRYGTGDRADTGVTGLALLAFLSAGHSHLEGQYRETVHKGLEYLLGAQMHSGDLSGPKQLGRDQNVMNAKMYCHGIATLALAEAYAMTRDPQLRPSLVKAAQYTIDAQDTRGGGWRYAPGDSGDLSQFGWQAMALRSVERSGIPVPGDVKQRMRRFLESCSAGNFGGLMRYRPAEGRPSETMTAEGLACRLLLGDRPSELAVGEAKGMLLANMPGIQSDNVYYWYYATLAMFQLQDRDWQRWNLALKTRLVQTQVPAYDDQAGSWEPDKLWGGYGGRVYATAMSCLCLEVYYRYLPMYQQTARTDNFFPQR